MILVNLGSGPDGVDGWFNYDWGWLPLINKLGITKWLVRFSILKGQYLRRWPDFTLTDIRKKLPLESSSVDWVYCSHVLEHLEKWEALLLLKEIKRILKKGGRSRVVIPDLNLIIIKYGANAEEFNRKYYGFEKDKKIGLMNRFIRPHNWMYNQASFIGLVKEAGFEKFEVSEFRKSEMPDIEQLDLNIHRDLSLYVELKK